jgi:hypothetical protein
MNLTSINTQTYEHTAMLHYKIMMQISKEHRIKKKSLWVENKPAKLNVCCDPDNTYTSCTSHTF